VARLCLLSDFLLWLSLKLPSSPDRHDQTYNGLLFAEHPAAPRPPSSSRSSGRFGASQPSNVCVDHFEFADLEFGGRAHLHAFP